MNRQHQTIYDAHRGTYIAVSEHSKRRGKSSKNKLIGVTTAALLILGCLNNAQAVLYSGDMSADNCVICINGVNGSVDISTDGNLHSAFDQAISASATGNITINTAANKNIDSYNQAIVAYSKQPSDAAQNIVINNNSNITKDSTAVLDATHATYFSAIEAVLQQIGDINITNNGTIEALGISEKGISATHFYKGNINITTNGAISGGQFGILADQSPSADVNYDDLNNINITTNAQVTSLGIGIAASNYKGGNTTITTNADINAGRTGIDVSDNFFGNNITVNTSGNISTTNPDNGYEVFTPAPVNSGEFDNSLPIAAIAVSSINGNEAKISINTVTGKTLTSVADGIAVESHSGTININNSSDIKTSSFIVTRYDEENNFDGVTETVIGNGINVSNALANSTIINSGNISVATGGFAIKGGAAVETVTSTAGILTGDVDLAENDDKLTLSGGTLKGSVFMGAGKDTLTINGTADVSAAPQLDGGRGAIVGWTEMSQDGSIPAKPLYELSSDVLNIEGVTVRGFTAASNDSTGNLSTKGVNLTSWEEVNVRNAATLKMSGDLFTKDNTGILNIDATSTLDLKGNSPSAFSTNGNVNNAGVMTMADGAADDVTTITGNYTGVTGSLFNIDTVLGLDNSATDKLVVQGTTSGTTTLNVSNAGGTGAQTIEGVQVVQVNGASNGAFIMTSPVQAGSYEYRLFKNGVSTPTDGDWYLRSTFVPSCANTPSLCPVDKPTYIYRPAVAAYVNAPTANADASFTMLSSLHQRMGKHNDLTTAGTQTWGRIIAGGQANNGHTRFEYDQTTMGMQFGRDLLHTNNASGTQKRSGVTAQYTHSSVDARDRIRPLVGLTADTGSMSSNVIGVGGYYTQIASNGSYMDITAQVNHVRNHFTDNYAGHSTQNGWQAGLSAEIGKPVAEVKGWQFEPQAQLSYLYSHYNDFADKLSHVDSLNSTSLRGRLGLRVHKDMGAAQYYGISNVIHDFLKPQSLTLHDQVGTGYISVNERFDKTTFELGAGLSGQVGKATSIYADARYEHSFSGHRSGAKFNVGIKTSF